MAHSTTPDDLAEVCARAATRFDGVLDGSVPNPSRLSRGEWIASEVHERGYVRTSRESIERLIETLEVLRERGVTPEDIQHALDRVFDL